MGLKEAIKSPEGELTGLEKLIQEIYREFEKDDICVDTIQHLMSSYKSNPADWRKYAKFDRHRYTRNLVDQGNGKFNLLVVCWGEGHGSAIHDHSDAHCFMKMLKGSLLETRFEWPNENMTQTTDDNYQENALKTMSRSELAPNEVCYINDSLGLHRVENASNSDTAVSLHLYSPPYSSCNVFNQQTGHRCKATVTFWSKFGEKRNKDTQERRAPEDN